MSQRHNTHVDETKKIVALKIKNAKVEDSGVYTVVVENPFGSDHSSGPVAVIPPAEPTYRPPSVSSMPAPKTPSVPYQATEVQPVVKPPKIIKPVQPETSVIEGEPVILNCVIEGYPTPQVSLLTKNNSIFNLN